GRCGCVTACTYTPREWTRRWRRRSGWPSRRRPPGKWWRRPGRGASGCGAPRSSGGGKRRDEGSRPSRGARANGGACMGGERHPKGLAILFLTEMWERFSFYLMLGILPLYLADLSKGGMGWSDVDAAVVVGSYMALVYFTPFLGGLIA